MTNVLRCHRNHRAQLETDSPERIERQLAKDIVAFLARDDVDRRVAAHLINNYVTALRQGTYKGCTPPQPPVREEPDETDADLDVDQELGDNGSEGGEEEGNG
jgi:hypothetical protein